MKLYQKIMAAVFVILAVCGVLCGWLLGTRFEKSQIRRAAALELQNYEATRYTLERIYTAELPADAGKARRQFVVESLFSQKLFQDYIWLEDGVPLGDASDYEILYDPGWETEGRFETTEYVMEETEGEYLMVIGSRLSFAWGKQYLFCVRDLTDIRWETAGFLKQFFFVWLALTAAASVLSAAASKLMLIPLEKLEKAAKAVSAGDYSGRLDIRRKDETGRLAEAFNAMEAQVDAHVRELTEAGERQKQLLGSLAHEIRTPMTAILGYSETLLHVKLNEKEQERALKNIYEQAGYLQRLSAKLMELLALHQNESIHMEPCDLREILEQAVWMEEKRWPDRSFWFLEGEADQESGVRGTKEAFRTVPGDRDLLLSLCINLLDNSAKASEPGQEIRAGLLPEGGFYIRDMGKGIPKEEIGKVTEPFYSTDKSRSRKSGLGLGLALCEKIAELHHAELQIESRAGEGTVIRVLFTNHLQDDEYFFGAPLL